MYNNVNEWTTLQERLDIAIRHGVKTRATIANLLAGRTKKNINVPLLEALVAKAEANKELALTLKNRAEDLGPRND